MATAGVAYIDLRARLDQFEKDLAAAERVAVKGGKTIGSKFQSIGASAGRVADKTKFLSLGLAAGLFKASQEASHLNEVVSFSRDVFGDATDGMVKWSETTLDSIGLASVTSLEAANNYGIFLTKMGNTKEEAAGLSQQLVKLAADMASAKDVPLDEALQAIASGLAGESEPLRRFGIDLREANLQQRALADGLIKGKQELKGQAQEQAKLNVILKESTVFTDNYAKTADSAANQQRRATEAAKEAGAALGRDLAPILADLAGTLANLLGAFTSLPDGVQKAVIAFAAFGVAISPVAKGIQGVSSLIGVFTKRAAAAAAASTAVGAATGAGGAGAAAGLGAMAAAALPATVAIAGTAAAVIKMRDEGQALPDAFKAVDVVVAQLKKGEITNEQFEQTVKAISDSTTEAADAMAVWRHAAEAMDRELRSQTVTIRGVEHSVEDLIRDLNNIPRSVTTTIKTVTQVSTADPNFNKPLLGRASGGPVRPRQTYLVGERGPEVLTMGSQGGNVIPNNRIGSSVHLHFHGPVYGMDDFADTVERALRRKNVRVGA